MTTLAMAFWSAAWAPFTPREVLEIEVTLPGPIGGLRGAVWPVSKQDGKPDRDRRAGKGTIPEAHAMVTAAPAATPGESTSTLSSLDKQADPGQPGDKDEVHVSEEELGVTTPREQRQ